MGMSASQCRLLALTARQSNLEFQQQMINNARLDLARKSTDAANAYADGMSNKVIRIAQMTSTGKEWYELNFNNLTGNGYEVIGANGASLDPSPYTEIVAGQSLSSLQWNNLTESQKLSFSKNEDGTYTYSGDTSLRILNPSYSGMDLQTLLMSGQGQIVTRAFYDYLSQHGYGTGVYTDDDGNETSYADLLDKWSGASTVNWQSDTTGTFKETLYTEDDAQVLADYEKTTAELQEKDKRLEMQEKSIETEHKAIQTEMDSLKKVIDKNIEQTYKSFA